MNISGGATAITHLFNPDTVFVAHSDPQSGQHSIFWATTSGDDQSQRLATPRGPLLEPKNAKKPIPIDVESVRVPS